MMMLISGVIGGLGLMTVLSKRTLLGVLIGVQLLIQGATMAFVLAGMISGLRIHGHVLGLFIILGGVAQLVVGYSLTIRMFFQKKSTSLKELEALKQ